MNKGVIFLCSLAFIGLWAYLSKHQVKGKLNLPANFSARSYTAEEFQKTHPGKFKIPDGATVMTSISSTFPGEPNIPAAQVNTDQCLAIKNSTQPLSIRVNAQGYVTDVVSPLGGDIPPVAINCRVTASGVSGSFVTTTNPRSVKSFR
jgi:hypothetical protein